MFSSSNASIEFLRRQKFVLLDRELAEVEIALPLQNLFRGEAARLVADILADNLHAVVPPVDDRLAMLKSHGLGL